MRQRQGNWISRSIQLNLRTCIDLFCFNWIRLSRSTDRLWRDCTHEVQVEHAIPLTTEIDKIFRCDSLDDYQQIAFLSNESAIDTVDFIRSRFEIIFVNTNQFINECHHIYSRLSPMLMEWNKNNDAQRSSPGKHLEFSWDRFLFRYDKTRCTLADCFPICFRKEINLHIYMRIWYIYTDR